MTVRRRPLARLAVVAALAVAGVGCADDPEDQEPVPVEEHRPGGQLPTGDPARPGEGEGTGETGSDDGG